MKLFANGKIISSASNNEIIEAFLVDNDGKIIETGNTKVLKKKYPEAEINDLNKKTVLPGLNDSHLHLFQYGLGKTKVNLADTTSIVEIKKRVKNYINENDLKENQWIEGKGWNDENFEKPSFPTASDLDEISQEYPIILKRACFHVATVNSKAMELCGINENTPDPEGGEIGRDENGKANGIFYDEAIEILESKIPQKNLGEIKEILKEAFTDALACGLTSIQVDDFFNVEDPKKILEAYLELKEEKEIPLRINLQMRIPSKSKINNFKEKGLITGYGDQYFKIGPLKFVLDGSLGARTAALKQPYNDKKSTTGKSLYEQEKFNDICKFSVENGYQIAVHAIGDKAIEMALNAFDYAYKNDEQAQKNRPIIVHAQISNEKLNKLMKDKGIIASIQPIFIKSDWAVIENRVGKERSKLSYAWKTYFENGIHLAGSSDAPIEPFNPFLGIYTAVCRQDLNNNPEKGWHPDEKMNVEEALQIFTEGSAYQSFEENLKGTLSEGKLADFVVIDRDITQTNPSSIKDTQVLATYVGGELVYEKN